MIVENVPILKQDTATWLKDHIYVPIIAGAFILILLGIFIYCCCFRKNRHGNSYVYKRLEYDVAVAEQMNRDRQLRQDEVRDAAYLKCQLYLRSHPNYIDAFQLTELGSRIDKYWFRVKDIKTQSDRMLSILPYNPKMLLPFSRGTCKTLKDLFSLLQHPYIFPLADFDFALEQQYIIILQPVSIRGSLKDYIYQAKFQDTWSNKYNLKMRGLSVPQVQLYGRQILEALLYLEEKGFPPHGSIHSGNIMFHDQTCKLTGFENAFLGNTSRIMPLIKKKLKDENKDSVDTLMFGHMLFEMSCGFELDAAHPRPQHLINCQSPAIVEILNFIFENSSMKYPSIREISQHGFFRTARLVELERYNPAPISLSPSMKTLLKAIKKGKSLKKRKSRLSSQVSLTSLTSENLVTTPTTPSNPGIPPPPPMGPPPSGLPPPPPPPPPGLGPSISLMPNASQDRSALLSSIQSGTKLKKTVTNDRSAPSV